MARSHPALCQSFSPWSSGVLRETTQLSAMGYKWPNREDAAHLLPHTSRVAMQVGIHGWLACPLVPQGCQGAETASMNGSSGLIHPLLIV